MEDEVRLKALGVDRCTKQRVAVLRRADETFIYFWDQGGDRQLLQQLGRNAADPTCREDWYFAAHAAMILREFCDTLEEAERNV